ncbi:hypothetical protein ACE6H2_004862 [Prunus campanulata]
MVSVFLAFDEEQRRGGREKATDWTMESKIIFFTDLHFAGNTDAIFGFFFIAFSGSGLTDAISSLRLHSFTTNFLSALYLCCSVYVCLISCKNLRL